ncbi:MAG: hypothetical protein ACYDGS_00855 [Thermoleophilia bacterium]
MNFTDTVEFIGKMLDAIGIGIIFIGTIAAHFSLPVSMITHYFVYYLLAGVGVNPLSLTPQVGTQQGPAQETPGPIWTSRAVCKV